jgi:16S rRNA (guanine527-N7)-methyltransferase
VTAAEIAQAMSRAGITGLPAQAVERFRDYLELLLRWNARTNLTSLRTPEEILQRHFIECSFAARNLPSGISTLLDFGSGAGFPGIPIAICCPQIYVTLAESQSKKAAFLGEVLRSLKLPAEVYPGRVEALPEERTFDAVAMRAVDKMERALATAKGRAKAYLVLFTTEPAIADLEGLAPEFGWNPPVPLPNSQRSVLLIGNRPS